MKNKLRGKKKKKTRSNKRKQKVVWVRDTRVDRSSSHRSVKKQKLPTKNSRIKTKAKPNVSSRRKITAATVNSWNIDSLGLERMRPGELRKFEVADLDKWTESYED